MNSRFTRRAARGANSSSTVPSIFPALIPSTMRLTIALFSSDTDFPPRLAIRMMLSDEAPRVAYNPNS
jgi:hypothetical protein